MLGVQVSAMPRVNRNQPNMAMAGSIIWFSALGFGARLLAKPLARPTVWRWVDIAVGTVMVLIAYRLARG